MRWMLHPQSRAGRYITVLNECTGSPNCWVEIRIEDNVTKTHVEVHLTETEATALRKEIKRAIEDSRANR